MKRALKELFYNKKALLLNYGTNKASSGEAALTHTVLLLQKKQRHLQEEEEEKEKKGEEEEEENNQVVAVVSSEVGQEQRLRQHHHQEMFQRSTLANFIKRRRREKETIRRFELVEKEVRARDPAQAEDLIRLREEHLTYHATWCRIKYHPRLLKVHKSEEEQQEGDETNDEIEQLLQSREEVEHEARPSSQLPTRESRRSHHGSGPRLNMIWERRLEDSERERLERVKELEVAREAFRKEMEKSLKATPSAGSRLYQTPRSRTFVPASSRPQRRRPSMPDKPLALGCSLDDFSVGTSRLSSFSSAFRRDAQPPPYSALQRAGKIAVQEYAKSGAKVLTKVKPFSFDVSGRKRHSCTVHHHFHH